MKYRTKHKTLFILYNILISSLGLFMFVKAANANTVAKFSAFILFAAALFRALEILLTKKISISDVELCKTYYLLKPSIIPLPGARISHLIGAVVIANKTSPNQKFNRVIHIQTSILNKDDSELLLNYFSKLRQGVRLI